MEVQETETTHEIHYYISKSKQPFTDNHRAITQLKNMWCTEVIVGEVNSQKSQNEETEETINVRISQALRNATGDGNTWVFYRVVVGWSALWVIYKGLD